MASQSILSLSQSVTARCKTLVNNDLKKICKEEGLVQSGNKAHLQMRIFGLINDAVSRGDSDLLSRLQYRALHHGHYSPPGTSTQQSSAAPMHSTSSPHLTHRYPSMNGFGQQAANGYSQQPRQTASVVSHTLFKDSAFYQFRDMILRDVTLDTSPSHRQTVTKNFTLTDAQCQRIRADPTLRLFLFSAMEQSLNPYSRLDITFPSQIEVKVNAEEVKANFKGLKGKPGSTRPVDITDFVRKNTGYKNQLQITYALTQKGSPQKYTCYVYLVKKESVDDLATRIKQRNVITKQSVISEMQKKASDPDIEVGSVNLSLKDPISTLRIKIPIRSTMCSHNACFDAACFLQLQEQAPTWQCPICNKTVSFEGLAVDQYVQEILDQVSSHTDQVTIDPNGNWSSGSTSTPGSKPNRSEEYYDDDSDGDLVEVPDFRVRSIKTEAVPTPRSYVQTPPLSSREASSVPRTGTKRKSEVIDLTLSDDDEPPRPAKKVNSYNAPPSAPELPLRYQIPSFSRISQPHHTHPHMQTVPGGSGLNNPSTSQSHNTVFGQYHQPTRQSYPGQGTSAYPTYLGSSP